MDRSKPSWRWLACSLVVALGCAPAAAPQNAPGGSSRNVKAMIDPNQSSSSTPTESPQNILSPSEGAPLAAAETWEAIYLNGTKLGYVQTLREPFEERGRRLWRTTIVNHLETARYNETTTQESRIESIETETGGLVRFESVSSLGAAPVKTVGEVDGDNLKMTTTIGDQRRDTTIAWDAEHYGGFDAVNKNLLRKPLKPGERRTLRAMAPGLDQPMLATMDMSASDWEEVTIGDEPMRLLRVNARQILPGAAPLATVGWLNERGETLKTELIPGMYAIRTTKEAALAKSTNPAAPAFDVGFDTVVRLDAVPGDLHRARKVVYRVALADGEPAQIFSRGTSQQVEATDDKHVARVTVRSLRPGDDDSAPRDPTPTPGETQANLLIQSDEPLIKRLAARATEGATTDAAKAAAIEQFVHNYIQQANFSQAFATATEVAKSQRGDCTEYSVLLAALARAAGIPARVAVGLVYTHSAGNPGFAFHMWDELYVDGHWIPFDATLGLGGIGGGHLKLSDSHLGDGAALASFLPVVQVMGRLNIDVESVE